MYLTGFMGAGKSTVGGLLAAELACPFVDLDAAVEAAAGRTVRGIFARDGEEGFRRLEGEQLRRTSGLERCVVATGGGTPIAAGNRRWMRAHGTIVWLEVAFDRLSRRVEDGVERPLWCDEVAALELLESRLEDYRDCDVAIAVGSKAPDEVVYEIADSLATAGLR